MDAAEPVDENAPQVEEAGAAAANATTAEDIDFQILPVIYEIIRW